MSSVDISETAKRTYRERLKFLRKGKDAFQAKEISKAVQYYATYLKALADYFGVTENHLDPKFFDLQKEKAELLLISQVYWDLSKSYDRSPGLQSECIRCLSQFVKFTVGFKHQHINAQVLKKYIRQNSAVNQEAFKNALTKIQVDSKNCYVASWVYGESHPKTCRLREIKRNRLNNTPMGRSFIDVYYNYSPGLVSYFEKNPKTGFFLTTFFLKPLIEIFVFSYNGRSRN